MNHEAREARLALVGEVIGSITYKPTTRFRWSGGQLAIIDTYLNSYGLEPEEYIWDACEPPVSVFETEDPEEARALVFDWVFENVALSELHEVAEFLQLGGQRIHDPHAGRHYGSDVMVGLTFPSGHKRGLERIP